MLSWRGSRTHPLEACLPFFHYKVSIKITPSPTSATPSESLPRIKSVTARRNTTHAQFHRSLNRYAKVKIK